MNWTWTIVRKDATRLRWLLLLWALLLVNGMALAAIQSGLDENTYYVFYLVAFISEMGLLPLLSFGLVVGLLHDDPVVDSDAFWITRPISGGRLLGAKAIALALLWLFPVLIAVPWWIGHAYPFTDLGRAALQTFTGQIVLTFLAVPFAILSSTGSRFFINLILTVAVLLALVVLYHLGGFAPHEPVNSGVVQSRRALLAGLWLVGSATAAVIQFRSRRTRSSLAVLLGAAVLSFAVATGWKWTIAPISTAPSEAPVISTLDLTVDSARIRSEKGGNASHEKIVTVSYRVGGLDRGDVALVKSSRHHFHWPDDSLAIASSAPAGDEWAQACLAVALGTASESDPQAELRVTAEAQAERLQREAPRYTAVIEGEIKRLKIMAEVPVAFGARSTQNGFTLKIQEVFKAWTGELQISISESSPQISLNRLGFIPGARAKISAPAYYFLINREDGRFLRAHVTPNGETLEVATVQYTRFMLDFTPAQSWKGNAPPDFSAWLKKATLVKVVAFDRGRFQRALAVPHFGLTPSTASVNKR